MGQCQPGCASCGSNSARGDAAPYLPHSGGHMAGHPPTRQVSEIRAGRGSTRGLKAAFHPLALARLGAVFIPETPEWKNERRQQPLPLLADSFSWPGLRRDRTGVSSPLAAPAESLQGWRAERAGCGEARHTLLGSASCCCCCEPAKPSIHSLRLALSLFSLILFTRVQPFARAKLSSDFITRGLFRLEHNFEDQGKRRPTQAEGPQSLVRRSVLRRETLTGRMYKMYWAKEYTRS